MSGFKQHMAEGTAPAGGGPGRTPDPSATAAVQHLEPLDRLIGTVESEVIPRLLRTLRSPIQYAAQPVEVVNAAPALPTTTTTFGSREVLAFVDQLLANEPLQPPIRRSLDKGVSVERVFRELLIPTAQYLGVEWERDRLNFAEVTVAMGSLQQLLRELSYDFQGTARAPDLQRSILLAPCPGEQHLFGCLLVAEYFRHAGWDVRAMPAC
ncbi:MAG: hypothetical protein AAFX85_18745, partial [Pseudomonadota bacterium]